MNSIPHENAVAYAVAHFIIKSLADREASELECIVTGQTPALAGIAGVRLERCGCFVNQNMIFSACCNCRGVLAMLLTTPADP